MKIDSVLLILLTLILFFNCQDNQNKRNPVMHMKNKEQRELLFFTHSNHLYGIDSQNDTVALDYEFSLPVVFGDQSQDGRFFLAEINSGNNSEEDFILVLNKDGRIIKTIPTLAKPYTLKIAANKLIVDSAVFYKNNRTALSIFNLENYELEYQSKTLGNWMTNRETWTWKNKIWLGIVPMAALDRPGYFWEYEPLSRKVNIMSEFISTEKREVYSFLIKENQLWILWETSLVVEIYDLIERKKTESINLYELLGDKVPEKAVAYDLRTSGDEVFTVIKDKTQQGLYQKLVFFYGADMNQLRVVPLSSKRDISSSTLLYFKNQKLYFKYLNQVDIFSLNSGELVKKMVVGNN